MLKNTLVFLSQLFTPPAPRVRLSRDGYYNYHTGQLREPPRAAFAGGHRQRLHGKA